MSHDLPRNKKDPKFVSWHSKEFFHLIIIAFWGSMIIKRSNFSTLSVEEFSNSFENWFAVITSIHCFKHTATPFCHCRLRGPLTWFSNNFPMYSWLDWTWKENTTCWRFSKKWYRKIASCLYWGITACNMQSEGNFEMNNKSEGDLEMNKDGFFFKVEWEPQV